jgi:hypothetical protein
MIKSLWNVVNEGSGKIDRKMRENIILQHMNRMVVHPQKEI